MKSLHCLLELITTVIYSLQSIPFWSFLINLTSRKFHRARCFPLNSPENRAVVVVLHGVISLIVLDAFGEAEVSDLHRALVLHQHISGSQVPVDVISRSQVVHSLYEKLKKKNQSDWNAARGLCVTSIQSLKYADKQRYCMSHWRRSDSDLMHQVCVLIH